MKIREHFILLFLFAVLTLSVVGCTHKIKPGTAESVPVSVSGITVQQVNPAPVPEYYETPGTVKATTVSQVAPKVMGTVTGLFVRSGDWVQAGQVLAALEDKESSQKQAAAEAGYREALKSMEMSERNRKLQRATYERYRSLYDSDAISRQQLDQIQTQNEVAELDYERAQEAVEQAAANREAAQAYQNYSQLIAPVSGMVTEKTIELGSMALAGTPVITVEDTSSFLLETFVEESLINQMKIGMMVDVYFPSINRKLAGKVSEIVPAVSSSSRSFLVKIALPADEGVCTGLYGKAQFALGQKQVLQIPGTAVVAKGELTGVYVLDEQQRLWYRLVRLGRVRDGLVEIIAGLNGGEQVVVDGMDKAVDGGKVQAVKHL